MEIDVNRCVNAITFVYRAIPSHGCDHLLADVIDGVSLALSVLPTPDRDLFGAGSCALFTADEPKIAHPVERKVPRLARVGPIRPWRKSVWALYQTGQRRALRQRHIARRLAKVPARGCFGSVHAATEINPVQIQLEDFLFAEIVFDALGQKNLEQLAAVCSFFERETVARQLLCDGAAALPHMACRQIFERCANDPQKIVAVVLIKFCVLDGNDGVDQIGSQLLVRDCLAVFDVDLAKDLPVAIENHTGRFHLIELVHVERVSLRLQVEDDAGKENCYKKRHHRQNRDGNIKPRPEIPWPPKAIARRRSEVCAGRSQAGKRLCTEGRRQTPNAQRSVSKWERKLNIGD